MDSYERELMMKHLVAHLEVGPVFTADNKHSTLTTTAASQQYKRWNQAWILPAVLQLLKGAQQMPNENGNSRTYIDGQFPKHCGCGRVYTQPQWGELQYRHIQYNTFEGLRYYNDLEQRDCVCMSTLSVRLENPEGEELK